MDKKKREALIIAGILSAVLVIVLAATIIIPKLTKDGKNENDNKKSTSLEVNEKKTTDIVTEEKTTWEFSVLEPITVPEEERERMMEEFRIQKRNEMKTLMTETEYVVECATCIVAMKEMYFDEGTMDGCFHITISNKEDTVIDDTWYELNDEGVLFGKYVAENADNTEKWRYSLYTEIFGNIDAEVNDNVLHIYAWIKDDAEVKSFGEVTEAGNREYYSLAWIFDNEEYDKNIETYNPEQIYIEKGIKYNKTAESSDGVEVTMSPTSIVIKGKKNISSVSVLYGAGEEFCIFDSDDEFGSFCFDRAIHNTDSTKIVLLSILRFEDVKAIYINEKVYSFE